MKINRVSLERLIEETVPAARQEEFKSKLARVEQSAQDMETLYKEIRRSTGMKSYQTKAPENFDTI